MKVIECSGETREEAIQQGLDELGVAMGEVERIDVIDEGSKGFLGLGKRPVRVRITVDMENIKPQRSQSRRDNRSNDRRPRQQNRSQRRGPDAGVQRSEDNRQKQDDEAGEETTDRRPRRSKRQGQGNRNQQERTQEDRSGEGQNRRGRGRRQSGQRDGGQRNRSQGGRQNRRDSEKQSVSLTEEGTEATRLAEQFDNGDDLQEEIVVEPIPEGAREEEAIEPISDDQGKEMAATLKEMVDLMGLQANVSFVRDKEDNPCLAMKSDNDSAILIGKHGITLNALQYLINRMLTTGDNENTERVMVDVGEYVSRRRASLVDMAKKMARRAKETGRNVKLKPLSPQERRIVHLALQKDTDIRTFSQGDSLYRSVIINPVNARRSGGSRSQRPQSRRRNQGQQNAARQGD